MLKGDGMLGARTDESIHIVVVVKISGSTAERTLAASF